ncbi:hypothetical protein [Mycobacterium kansasii]|uniref:hypothetical protein n=1 Tax=Mycobacterium kansasii TaxID=1768 RepID=UPI001157FD57|nr:hypothetical protein [Mycobacterium kansasii]
MIDVPAVDDPRIMISIPVPVKGRKPVVLKVPRFDFMGEDVHQAWEDAAKQAGENKDMPLSRQQRITDLAALKLVLPEKDYKVCETLTSGQLQIVMLNWAKESAFPLGELLASADSLTGNTEAPSSMTSTAQDGPEETSDPA